MKRAVLATFAVLAAALHADYAPEKWNLALDWDFDTTYVITIPKGAKGYPTVEERR